MHLFFLGPMFFVAFLSLYTFSYNLSHTRNVFLSLSKSTIIGTVIVEEDTFTPRFHYQKTTEAIENYFISNLNEHIDYELTLTFYDQSSDTLVLDNSADRVDISFSAHLVMTYNYRQTLTISLEALDA